MIEIKNIYKTYKSKKGVKTQALDNVSFSLPDKGLYFILGKSGSGKSTLLNILGGLDKYDSGEIIVDGKNTKKFREKDFDYYRNTYIGFVFQEFNLLEEYNVYDNIILSKKLQKEKVSFQKIDDLLTKVGIDGLGKRKINELSGGQKQRVAMARALIKNPKIILADEPTGSLDEETGKQIFELLKQISREKLVIVVSHDRESALLYANGMIELRDGKVILNNIEEDNLTPSQAFKAKKSHLPLLSSLKFSLLNLGTKKIKLIFTIILIAMSLIFFGMSKVLSHFDIEESYANTMVDSKEEYITISKTVYDDDSKEWLDDGTYHELDQEDMKAIQNKIKSPLYLQYKLNEDNMDIGLEINFKDVLMKEDKVAYYMMVPASNNFHYIEADASFINQNILGKFPTNYDEIMIHRYLADYIIKAGVLLYDNSSSFKQEYYMPTSYEEIINDAKYLKLGSTKVKISGIILDDIDQYESLKNTSYKMSYNTESTTWFSLDNYNSPYMEFSARVLSTATNVYVAKGFINNILLKPNTRVDVNSYNGKISYNNVIHYLDNQYSYLEKKINMYNGSKTITIDKLNDNEIVINEAYLDSVSNRNYSQLKEQYVKEYKEKEKNIIEENKKIQESNQKKLEEYTKKLEANEEVEEPLLMEEKEFDFKTEEDLTEEFISNYLKENNILSSTISLSFHGSEFLNETKEFHYDNIKIVGIQMEDNSTIYMASNIASEVMRKNSYCDALLLRSNNKEEIKQIFIDFPLNKNKYLSHTVYSLTIGAMSSILNGFSDIFFYLSVIFGIFAFILLTNFIVNSIYYNKKNIGVLRALGARKSDIFKIFLNEGILIGLFSLIISLVVLYTGIYYTNQYISSHLFFHINFISLTTENLLILVGSVLGIVFLSSLFTVKRIARMKPVDAILNK